MSKISFYSRKRPTVRYQSSTTVYEEALDSTRFIGLYWSASGYVQRENVVDSLPTLDPLLFKLQSFELEINGQELHNHWEWVSFKERSELKPDTKEAIVELRHQILPLTIKVITRLDDTPFLVRYLEITNTGSTPMALSRVSPLSGILWTLSSIAYNGSSTKERLNLFYPETSSAFTLGYFDSIAQGNEGNFVWEPLPRGTRRIECNNGRSGWGGPYFIIRNELTGEYAVGALAWSGSWYIEFWNDPFLGRSGIPERGFTLSFSIGPSGKAPLRVISPGETIKTPEVHLALLHTDFDECVNTTYAHLRKSVIPPMPKEKRMYALAGRVVEYPGDWIFREIDISKEMGVEGFMVDAGWYGEEFDNWWQYRGDWQEGSWIPGGLNAVREYAHKNGLLFGLWMEPESVGPKSKILKEHPDWILSTDDGRQIGIGLNLANPQAVSYLREQVLRVISEYKLDFFKIDYNILTKEGGQNIINGYAEHEEWRHYEVIYELFDSIRKEFPDLVLENCAAGGGRNDLGMLSRFHYSVISDFSTFPRSIRALNGLTLFIPPEALVYYHNHIQNAHQMADLDTHLRVCLFSRVIFVGFGAQDADRTSEYFEKTRRYIRLIKDFTGPILGNHPLVFHHTPDIGVLKPADWCVLEYISRDRTVGYVGIFKLESSDDTYLFRSRGLDPSKIYEVTLDNKNFTFECNGGELISKGLPITLTTPYTSELILFRAKE